MFQRSVKFHIFCHCVLLTALVRTIYILHKTGLPRMAPAPAVPEGLKKRRLSQGDSTPSKVTPGLNICPDDSLVIGEENAGCLRCQRSLRSSSVVIIDYHSRVMSHLLVPLTVDVAAQLQLEP